MNELIRPDLTPFEEAELKIETLNMYRNGGVSNVLSAVALMIQCQIVILRKLEEILEEENGFREP